MQQQVKTHESVNCYTFHWDDDNTSPPKTFWKFYDLYRRKEITFDEYVNLSGIPAPLLSIYLGII